MELKDVIMSTLAEMEETPPKQTSQNFEIKEKIFIKEEIALPIKKESIVEEQSADSSQSELLYLSSIKERLLVLFEGFQAPNNTNIEAKVDMTLNFLEYTLATIEKKS
ncbi:MAG: hypothetical protein Q9M43_08820 [Sulfurimonas sp.]|nr:hypothetical protein [Sulfurimonas sp.]